MLDSLPSLPAHISTHWTPPSDELLKRSDLVLPHLFAYHAIHNPNYPFFVYNDGVQNTWVTYSEVNAAMTRAARYFLTTAGPHPDSGPGATPRVVAVMANSDSIVYLTTILGLLRAGFTGFLVSTRNAPVAVADMMQRTDTALALVSADASMQALARGALELLAESGASQPMMHVMPTLQDLYPALASGGRAARSPFESDVVLPDVFPASQGVIMHSSGSTGHPKPIKWNNARLTFWGEGIMRNSPSLTGAVLAAHSVPLFHGMGALTYAGGPFVGLIVGVFEPKSPPTVPTPDLTWNGIVAVNADFSFTVPSFVEQWAQDPTKVSVMKTIKGLVFGGAALNEDVGNSLASQGVSLYTMYGATEVGLFNDVASHLPGLDWLYWTPSPSTRCEFMPVGDGTFEVVAYSDPRHPLPKTNGKIGEHDVYETNDLAVPHPTKPNFWKIVGRADEQIILSNGEKTNPIPLEKLINDDPHVKSSIIFGRGRLQNGVLVEPEEEFSIDPTNENELIAFRNKIWPTMEGVNAYAPQHSRIFKEMILVAHPLKPFQLNSKGYPRRSVMIGEYKDEIDALYRAVEESAQTDIPSPTEWTEISTYAFVKAVVEAILQRSLADDVDVFRNGSDSLQATWIRNTITAAVRATRPAKASRLTANMVFSYPTIASLSAAVFGAVTGDGDGETHTPKDLWKYIEKYSANFPARPEALKEREAGAKDVVVITGTTGGFGCDALEHLLREENVAKVYAFNRRGSDAMARQRTQFAKRGLDESLLDSAKFTMVEANLHEPGFGIDGALLNEIRGLVSHVLLNAWKVNFNMSLQSFEVDMQGARNFIDLSLSSPYAVAPTVLLASSIGVFSNYNLSTPVPEVQISDPQCPFGSGYAESKWVTEHVLENAAKQTGIRTVVVRLGQITSDKLGYWNEKEWLPSLVKTALFQHCLPGIEGTVSWFPAYEAAKAFVEMRHSSEPVLHLIHPRPVPYNTLVAPIAAELGVPLVPYAEWLAKLRASIAAVTGTSAEIETLAANPALRLLPFFEAAKVPEGAATAGREPMGIVELSTEKAVQVSKALADLPQMDAARATRWVAAWKKAGFLV
ncbi:acetyl-CoA synthetase-like protein [Epithele typhae]|uniref:acetyl-CoA synthetase-like protein n=1 Tax=Epithele typhae TaxID=378194 RepID=UPI002007379E|nr:acetyl-CoA synthetase-like protein [Epithele typhae]KAH9939795.1 acetyl-CoA synthetase-like protein [Epithele typhae]